jgi:hypothetical protein
MNRRICLPLLQRRGQRQNRPKGEQRTAQAFRPGKTRPNELALKLKGRPNRDGRNAQMHFTYVVAFTDRAHGFLWSGPRIRPPLQGDSVLGRLPRPEGLGCSVFALRAIGPSASKSKRGLALIRHESPGYYQASLRDRIPSSAKSSRGLK